MVWEFIKIERQYWNIRTSISTAIAVWKLCYFDNIPNIKIQIGPTKHQQVKKTQQNEYIVCISIFKSKYSIGFEIAASPDPNTQSSVTIQLNLELTTSGLAFTSPWTKCLSLLQLTNLFSNQWYVSELSRRVCLQCIPGC